MLGNFTYCNPTRLYFGEDALENLGAELAKYGKNVLLVYGGGSIKKSGLYGQVSAILADCGAVPPSRWPRRAWRAWRPGCGSWGWSCVFASWASQRICWRASRTASSRWTAAIRPSAGRRLCSFCGRACSPPATETGGISMHKNVLIISTSPRRGGRGRRPQFVAAFPSFCIDARPSPIAGGKNPQAAGQGRLPHVGRAGAGAENTPRFTPADPT